MEKISNIKLSLNEDESTLILKAAKILKTKPEKLHNLKICKKSLDARDKNNIFYLYTVEVCDSRGEINSKIALDETIDKYKKADKKGKIVIVGSGPAGLFCALYLSRAGLEVTVIERGSSVENRRKDVDNFIKTRLLDTNSNVQFGEGGAGTFSDGKLNTQTGSPLISRVLNDFVNAGAPQEIAYLNKPHIGSDNLPKVVANIREEIKSRGGCFLFNTTVKDVVSYTNGVNGSGNAKGGDKIKGLIIQNVSGESEIDCDEVVFAIGHSARDTFEMLYKRGVLMQSKDFAVGVRIEHLREDIDKAQYGKLYNHPRLKAADYKLVSHASDRGVFTFCMCPGGYVMPATSEKDEVVVNGMSLYGRDSINSNSAVVAQVSKEDFGDGVLSGMYFQRELERKAFLQGGGDYSVPVSLVGDFLKGKTSEKLGKVTPSYPLGYNFCDISDILPQGVCQAIKLGIEDMDRRLKGFASDDAVISAVESRTSSPVRILRKEDLSSCTFSNMYPAGEGAGYAGGITSAAVDGIKVAEKIIEKYTSER